MNFVIDNYTTSEDTQPMYFHQTLIEMDHKSYLCDSSKESVYDIFDRYKPDVYITHGHKISQDVIHYINNNENKIDVLINISAMSNEDVQKLSQFFFANNITSSLFFSYLDSDNLPKIKDRNIISLCNAADLNLLQRKNTIKFNVDIGVLVKTKNNIKEYDGIYHNISNYESLKDDVDFVLPELLLAPLYKSYKTIVLREFNGYLPQSLFDAIIFDCSVYFDLDNKDSLNKMNDTVSKILKTSKTLDINDNDRLIDFSELKTYILEKHTSKNRVKTLLSNIRTKK
ncbi:hypothetical protein EB118_00485 [bacterium]|nr:hypothetical protein [bacterium]